MTLAPGQTLSFYEILGPLGAGAMGAVYRARDSRLDREVAVKVLPEHFAKEPERLERFEREAKALAALNHPNVAQIFGVDQADGTWFLVLELVPGETLEDRLKRGALPVDEALDVCCQIAAGLEAAHEGGIVHRDLKPANVRITPEGKVKVLDFGLAKPFVVGGGKGADEGALSTEPGRMIGTPMYMAPEQARGKPIDRRVDVWAFGCVLFECLTGVRAFAGETVSDVLAAVLEREPEEARLPSTTPPRVRDLVQRCLAKDSHARPRDIGDIRLQLADARSKSSTRSGATSGADATVDRRWSRRSLAMTLVGLVSVAGTLGLSALFGSDGDLGATPGAARWPLGMPAGSTLGWAGTSANLSKLGGGSPLIAISPDGRRIVFCVDHGGRSELFLHDVGAGFSSRPIPGTEYARGPFFSPDGEWIGFFADEALQIVPVVDGGAPQPVCRFSSPNFAGCWMDDESIVYSTTAGLWRVPAGGGEPERLTTPNRELGEVEHASPSAVPGENSVLFTVATHSRVQVALLDLDSGDVRPVIREGTNAHLLPGGRLVYSQAGGIRTRPFELAMGAEAQISVPVQDDVYRTPSAGGAVITHFAVSRTGTLVFAPAIEEPTRSTVYWVDRKGNRSEPIVSGLGFWEHPRLAPDGERFAIDILDIFGGRGRKDVYVFEPGRGLSQLTEDGMSVMSAWAPAEAVAVRSIRDQDLIRLVSTFDRSVERLIEVGEAGVVLFADGWTPDRRTMLLTRKDAGGRSLWAFTLGDVAPAQLIDTKFEPRYCAISDDGKWLAYVRQERGRNEVYVRPYPALDRSIKISIDGGAEPFWARHREGLFYRHDGTMVFVPVETDPEFRAGTPEALFLDTFDAEPGGHRHYDLSKDGERFLMIEHQKHAPDRLHVVLNWTAGLAPAR